MITAQGAKAKRGLTFDKDSGCEPIAAAARADVLFVVGLNVDAEMFLRLPAAFAVLLIVIRDHLLDSGEGSCLNSPQRPNGNPRPLGLWCPANGETPRFGRPFFSSDRGAYPGSSGRR